MKISVIVPVYNVEKYLRQCIDSILRQTFTDFELILVDDGSPDRCPEFCSKYAVQDCRVKVIHQSNGGLSAARNRGITEAKGEYLCFIDSDDFVAGDFLQYLYDLICCYDADFSVCGTIRFADGSEPKCEEYNGSALLSPQAFFRKQLSPETEMGVWNKLFRREIFDRIMFENGRVHEDVLFSAALALHCNRGAAYGNSPKYFYRQRKNSIVAETNRRCNADRVYAGRKVIEFGLTVNDKDYLRECMEYALTTPWLFIDGIFVRREFKENMAFMKSLQQLLKDYLPLIRENCSYSPIVLHRMNLFSKSLWMYGLNAYVRLFRVYLYRLLNKDAYCDGHGI